MAPKGAVFVFFFISEQDVIPTRRSADQTSAEVAGFPFAWQPLLVGNVANDCDTPAEAVVLSHSGAM